MSGEINLRLQQIKKEITATAMAKEAHQYFRKITPIAPVQGGNARRNTFLVNDTVQANYPYAQRLDQGYSRQAPDGMSKPTIQYMQDLVKKQSKG
jgi:hypothetical protein